MWSVFRRINFSFVISHSPFVILHGRSVEEGVGEDVGIYLQGVADLAAATAAAALDVGGVVEAVG